jgi:putative transcriptional regulator
MRVFRWPRARRPHLAAAVVALALTLAAAQAEQGGAGSLAGQLLVASPDIGDPRFAHTVILLLRQDASGAFGIVLNRPVEERSIAALLDATGTHERDVDGKIEVFSGGPVQPELGFVVHSPDYHDSATLAVGNTVAMTADRQILRDMGHHKGPKKALFAFGYAGWGPGQLEGEIARHDWFTAIGDPKLIFDDDRSNLWDDAMARRTQEL